MAIGGKPDSYKYLRCINCGRLLTDKLIKLGICAGHKMTYASQGNFFEWILIKLGIWEIIAIWKAKREKKKYEY